jgi:hypothetical protein
VGYDSWLDGQWERYQAVLDGDEPEDPEDVGPVCPECGGPLVSCSLDDTWVSCEECQPEEPPF